MKDEKLDGMLRGWGEKAKPDAAKVQLLTGKVLSEVKRGPSQALVPPRPVSLIGLRFAYGALGAVAACFLIAVLYGPLPRPVGMISGRERVDLPLVRETTISAGDVKVAAELVSQLNYLFPEKLRWIESSDGKLNIELVSTPYQERLSSDCVVIRLVLFKREKGGSWQNVWATETISALDGVVEVVSDRRAGNRITLWAHLLPDGLLAVDSNLKLKSPVELTTSFSKVLEPGKPARILLLKSGNVDYCIFQTARYLQIKRAGSV